ncbi:MAG TPA: hypothetical protein VKH44_08090 [Pirellulaceae bacterium]|nr:hypothetical protein [Pirellulaceae bacterium]
MDKVEVVNYRAFGEKVKAWTKGTAPLPKNIEEFASQLADADVGVKIPKRFKHVKFVQSDEDTLVVRLPCKATLAASEERLAKQGGDYPLPTFYEQVFEAKPKIRGKMDFHAERIGDYSIANCG